MEQAIELLDYQNMYQIAHKKKKLLIGNSIDYSLQYMKPFWLRYARKYAQYLLITPVIKIESIRILLSQNEYPLFEGVIQEFMKIETIIYPDNEQTYNNDSVKNINGRNIQEYLLSNKLDNFFL